MQKKRSMKRWTEEEDKFLLESYGTAGMQFLMDRLQRSRNAICLRHYRLTGSMNIFDASGDLKVQDVAEGLGVSDKTIRNWIEKYDFPAKRKKKVRNDTRKGHVYYIQAEDVWRWVKKNKHRIAFLHIKRGIIYPEPDWLDDEIKKSRDNYVKPPLHWTREEDEAAYFYWKCGMPYSEISKLLQRPSRGVQKRINMLAKEKRQKVLS